MRRSRRARWRRGVALHIRQWHRRQSANPPTDLEPRSPRRRLAHALADVGARASITVGEFLTRTWLPLKRRQVREATAYRYSWFVERHVKSSLGEIPLRRLRADHLDLLCDELASSGGRGGDGLAPKTILEVHMIVRAALDLAATRGLVSHNVAHGTRPRRRPPARAAARVWNTYELASFIAAARHHRLYPALHLAAHTGMRRGEIVGLKWSDFDRVSCRLSISRTLQNLAGTPVDFGVKTRSSPHGAPRSGHPSPL